MATEHRTSLTAVIVEHCAVVREFVHLAAALTHEQWNTPRAPDRWTPAQETAHVILTYRGFTAELRAGPEVDATAFPGHPELRRSVLPRILGDNWFPIGGTAPAYTLPVERPGPQETLLTDLVRSAGEFEDALQGAAQLRPDRFSRHPCFGALTLGELLRLSVEHTRRHPGFLPAAER